MYISSPKSSFGTNFFKKSEINAFFFNTGLNPFLFGIAQSTVNPYRTPLNKVFALLHGALHRPERNTR